MTAPILRNGGHVVIPATAHLELRTIPIRDIALPDNHCGMDWQHVHELAAVQHDHHLEPVLLLARDHGYWLIAGRHRFLTAIICGRDSILAVTTDQLEIRHAGRTHIDAIEPG
jgi:hypothetical protein